MTHASASAATALAGDLNRSGLPVSGVHGPNETAAVLARALSQAQGCGIERTKTLRIRELREVAQVTSAPGQLRLAREDELGQLSAWFEELWVEAGGGLVGVTGLTVARRNFTADRLFVWDHYGPVSMASATGATPNGIRVSGVYTPSAHRGHGYATSCVATLSARLLAEGRGFCFLYTDASNPTPNIIYQRIGYLPVADVQEYRLVFS